MTRDAITLPIELTGEFRAEIRVPRDLMPDEAHKLARVLRALAGCAMSDAEEELIAERRSALKINDNRGKDRG